MHEQKRPSEHRKKKFYITSLNALILRIHKLKERLPAVGTHGKNHWNKQTHAPYTHANEENKTLQKFATRTWGTGKRSCPVSVTPVPPGLFTTGRRAILGEDKTDFEEFSVGTTYNKNKNIHGFYKDSPVDHNTKNPFSGFATKLK